MKDNKIKQSMIDHIHTLQAGKRAIDPKTELAYPEAINNNLLEITKRDLLGRPSELSDLLKTLLANIVTSDLSDYTAEHIDRDRYYALGEYLLNGQSNDSSMQSLIHNYLDVWRLSPFLQRIYGEKRWDHLILELLQSSNFSVRTLLDLRSTQYEDNVIFRVLYGESQQDYTWKSVHSTINRLVGGLKSLTSAPDEKIAFLTENSIKMVFLDLACLYGGMVNVMIPANSVPEQIEYILNETRATVIIVSNDKQMAKLKAVETRVPTLKHTVLLEGSSLQPTVYTYQSLLEDSEEGDQDLPEISVNDLATIMYTSGTTGYPKGIMFSHLNIVYKRFCRALAIPKMGYGDRFLSYLPLYHTFGRWLEMMGAIFWGAEYTFMENPALSTMINNMQRIKPTIFISIPKKWYQLYEYITGQVDIEVDDEEKINQIVKGATGGFLQWGLSAAGHLDTDVFQFFQRYGIELMSGFGMTEATGGITMTPPGKYMVGTLGEALPGIDVRLGEDGEMFIKGAYVMEGYFGQDDAEVFDKERWLPTGDIMRQNEAGYFIIIDRKKEIYKNIKGETIAPQKVENLFRDFESVDQVFLVGDHRPFNTVLIHPDKQANNNLVAGMDDKKINEYFSSVIVTINKFLAPFERIVDFRLTNRSFSADKGELTPKGTYKRRVIEKNFEELIDTMYEKHYISLSFDSIELRIPNWFLREIGCLTHDLHVTAKELKIEKYNKSLTIKKIDNQKQLYQIGDYNYFVNQDFIDLQIIFANPLYWLGNRRLMDFTGQNIFQWYRLDNPNHQLQFRGIFTAKPVKKKEAETFTNMLEEGEQSLFGLDLAFRHLQSPRQDEALKAVNYFDNLLQNETLAINNIIKEILTYPQICSHLTVQRQLFKLGLPYHTGDGLTSYLQIYLNQNKDLLDEETVAYLVEKCSSDEGMRAVHRVLKNELVKITPDSVKWERTAVPGLLDIFATCGVKHPARYKRSRQLIVRYQLRNDYKGLPEVAYQARKKLLDGFRLWLGDEQSVAVDIETQDEYTWADVVTFEENIPEEDRNRIIHALNTTSLLREAIFLLSGGDMVRLYDIPQGGIWISLLSDSEKKSTYRIAVQTRFRGSYDVTLKFDKSRDEETVRSEINWMIHAGAPAKGLRLVHDFGGYWQEHRMWTEDYVSGYPVDKIISRGLRGGKEDDRDRIYHLWPFFVQTAVAGHVSFWKRTGYRWEVKDKSISNIIIPPHDYQTGIHFVSFAQRKQSSGLLDLLHDFYKQFIEETDTIYPFLKRESIRYYMIAGVLDSEGKDQGVSLLKNEIDSAKRQDDPNYRMRPWINDFLKSIEKNGYLPKKLKFAIKRYHRWFKLNQDASVKAQAQTLRELYDTYQLHELEAAYPDTRTSFFIETVFKNCREPLFTRLNNVALNQQKNQMDQEQLMVEISAIRSELKLSDKEKYFLTRLSYPHLKPTDEAELVSTLEAGQKAADVLVQLEDYNGIPYSVRKPVSPKEISRLHQLFLESNLPVTFRPAHRFLIALSERGFVIGGLFYLYMDNDNVYMDKIVVGQKYRRKGISEG
ncbi:MAG: AMP-binding protein, partial [Caldithrix sp.]|nr:AMP-binding protein [Caldithrix sp.]